MSFNQKEYHKLWEQNNPERLKQYNLRRKIKYHKNHEKRNYNLQKNYGITYEDYQTLLVNQYGVCAICKKKETATRNNKIRDLNVDHNHTTNKIRGLLCSKCNIALGLFEDNITTLISAIKYLEENN